MAALRARSTLALMLLSLVVATKWLMPFITQPLRGDHRPAAVAARLAEETEYDNDVRAIIAAAPHVTWRQAARWFVSGDWLDVKGGGPFWRPLVSCLWWFEYRLWGDDIVLYNIMTVMLAILACTVLAGAVADLCRSALAGAAAAGFFLHTIAGDLMRVFYWFPAQTDVLAGAWIALALGLLAWGTAGGRRRAALIGASLLCYVGAALSKEAALAFPLAAWAVLWARAGAGYGLGAATPLPSRERTSRSVGTGEGRCPEACTLTPPLSERERGELALSDTKCGRLTSRPYQDGQSPPDPSAPAPRRWREALIWSAAYAATGILLVAARTVILGGRGHFLVVSSVGHLLGRTLFVLASPWLQPGGGWLAAGSAILVVALLFIILRPDLARRRAVAYALALGAPAALGVAARVTMGSGLVLLVPEVWAPLPGAILFLLCAALVILRQPTAAIILASLIVANSVQLMVVRDWMRAHYHYLPAMAWAAMDGLVVATAWGLARPRIARWRALRKRPEVAPDA